MGITRGWRSAMLGTVTALGALAVVTGFADYALATWLPESALQLVIGTLLLIFGLQWLRKAILRSSGRKAIHDEDEIYQEQTQTARAAARGSGAFDTFSFMVSFKGVFLEGMEVVFIIITFGLSAGNIPVAVYGALAAVVIALVVAVLTRGPLSMIPENLLKYAGGAAARQRRHLLGPSRASGIMRTSHESLSWPGHDLAILALLAAWFVLSRVAIKALRAPKARAEQRSDVVASTEGGAQ